MALVAVNAVVNVARDVVVMEVGRVVVSMAPSALEHRVVIRIRMAGSADVIRVSVTRWELRVLRVIECRSRPRRGVVAGLAGGREELWLRRVSWIRRVVVVRLVAADARCRQGRVVVVDVAIRANAWRYQVRSRQRERCVVVIERGVSPDDRVVTEFAGGRESRRSVRRIVRVAVILLMARIAQRAIQRVIVVDMAVRTLTRRHRVRSGQGKSGGRVIELSVGPQHRVVAGFARKREACGGVVHRRQRIRVVGLMARHAGRAGKSVVIVDVAIGTLTRRNRMRARQRESGAVVIERSVQPGTRVVALLAGLREVRRNVIGIRRSLKIFQVARHAGRAGQVVIVVDVTIRALTRRNRMRSGQRKACAGMVELRVQPVIETVALLARC